MAFTNLSHIGRSTLQSSIKISSALPKHILVGYWHNWDASPAAFIPLHEVSSHFDVINIAFATCSENGKVLFAPHADTKQFEMDILSPQSLGKKVLLSVGGATGSLAIDNIAVQDNFSESIIKIVQQYGFDGIDINLEGKVVLDRGDADFKNPTSASIRYLIAALREIKSNFGPEFMLSLTPETINVQGGFHSYESSSGSYLPVIHALRDILTYVQIQHYNSGALPARDHNAPAPGTAGFHIAMAEMFLQGFPIQANAENVFPPLKPEQVVIGLAVCPEAVNNGYTTPHEMKRVLDHLAKRESPGGVDSMDHGSPRGVMIWSINWDAVHQQQFSSIIRSHLDALP